ncbi:hypothetical protein FXO37_05795 [Capsicum annuum]|nr:hypothetical protein FXO37_05795 [Capsicum annuum]
MAHASVASLVRIIESLLTSNSPMQSLTCDNHREEFCALHEKISSLEVIAKNFEKNNVSGEMADLEVQIKEVANVVEQTIQLRVPEVVLENVENLREKAQERLSDILYSHYLSANMQVWLLQKKYYIKEILMYLLQSTIKMDDTVKTKVWDGVRRCFPTEDNAGSCILLTTRNNEVACYAGTENLSMQMNFMDQDESWNLFKSVAFQNEALSSEFETIGK